jgi:hypothetical protein
VVERYIFSLHRAASGTAPGGGGASGAVRAGRTAGQCAAALRAVLEAVSHIDVRAPIIEEGDAREFCIATYVRSGEAAPAASSSSSSAAAAAAFPARASTSASAAAAAAAAASSSSSAAAAARLEAQLTGPGTTGEGWMLADDAAVEFDIDRGVDGAEAPRRVMQCAANLGEVTLAVRAFVQEAPVPSAGAAGSLLGNVLDDDLMDRDMDDNDHGDDDPDDDGDNMAL